MDGCQWKWGTRALCSVMQLGEGEWEGFWGDKLHGVITHCWTTFKNLVGCFPLSGVAKAWKSTWQQVLELQALLVMPWSLLPVTELQACCREEGVEVSHLFTALDTGITLLCTPEVSGKELSAQPRPVGIHLLAPLPAGPKTQLFTHH